jgi:hypothetical protein
VIAPATVLALSRDVRFRSVGGEMVLLSQRRGEVLVVNEVGAYVVGALDGITPLSAIAERIAATFQVGVDRALTDALAFAAHLVELGIVEEQRS